MIFDLIMKTIFITVQLGSEIKNWFLGDFYKLAKETPDIRLVAFAPLKSLEMYRAQFGHERCIFELLPDINFESRKLHQFFRTAAYASVPTDAVWFRTKYYYLNGGSLVNYLVKQTCWFLGHTTLWRAFLRFAEYYLFKEEGGWGPCFNKYNPDVVFATTTYRDVDVLMIKYAKKHGIPSVGMLRGWDNMSSKAFLFVHPDILLVQNQTMVREAVVWNDFPVSRIKLIGFPYFDHYLDPSWKMSREEVARVIGADPSKKWIAYFVGGIFVGFLRAGDGRFHAALLDEVLKRGEVDNVCILASIHPGYRGDWESSSLGEHFKIIRLTKEWNFSLNATKVIMNFIRECDIAVDFGSSLALETAIFNKPTIFVGFNSEDDSRVPWHKRISVAYDYYTHAQYLLNSGGVWKVSSFDELNQAIKSYLDDSSLHREGRARIVEKLVGPLDGGAGRRAFETIVSLI